MGSWWNEIGAGDEFSVAASLGASFSRIDSSTSTSDSTSSTPIGSSNIGFQLLKKHGWKEGTGLGVSEQAGTDRGTCEKNKRGLGADREIKKKDKSKKVEDQSELNEKQPPKRQKKGIAKKIRQMQELEKRMKETEMERAIFREFWADNV